MYVDLRPWDVRPVQVLHRDGSWYDGELEAYRQRDGRWEGRVRYAIGVGLVHIDWLDESDLRPAGKADSCKVAEPATETA